MKALVKADRSPGLVLEDVPKPQAGPNDVLVRVLRTGICGTDVHIYKWDEWSQRTIPVPMVIGHEIVGEVAEAGGNVTNFKTGEVVSGEGHLVCGACRHCLAGKRHLCPHTMGVGVNRAGAFAEYISIPATNLWKHAPGVDLDVAAIFDPFGNAAHAALSFPVLGEDVLITGAGPIGVMSTAIVRHAGARHVVVTDLNPKRLEVARRMGATRAVDPRETPLDAVLAELDMKEGFDIGLEMSGSSQALDGMMAHMAHGGSIALLGIPARPAEFDWNPVIFKGLNIKGIYGREMFDTWYKMSVMLQSGLRIDPVITHRFPAEEFERGFAAMQSGDCGKVILSWS
jgi:threonine 3-dehydrogenase